MIRAHSTANLTVVDAEPVADRVCQALDEFLSALQAGQPPVVEDWLRQYPDIATILRDQLDGLLALHTAAHSAGPAQDLLPDPRQIDSFRLRREIGRGGMGVVYEADDTALGRRVALKILPFAAVLDPKQLTRFQNEAQAASRLHHPHIVPVYSVGCDRGLHYYAMQYINGRSLEDAIAEFQQQKASRFVPLDAVTRSWRWDGDGSPATSPEYFRRVAELGRDVASGLQHAHELGVLHRDIKPSNLLLDAAGKVWITDFGLARLPGDVSVTCTGEVLGSARYMSPEQASGRKAFVDHRTDVYSLGITLYELAALRPAFATESRAHFLQQVQHVDPILPRRLNPQLPLHLQAIICRAMQKDPRRRYGSAQEMAEDLQRFLDARPTLAAKTHRRDRRRRWMERHRLVLRAVAAVLVLGVVGACCSAVVILRAYDEARTQYQNARSAVDQFGATMSRRLASIPGASQVRKELLTETLAYYRGFIQDAMHDESLYQDVGDAYLQIGRIHEQMGEIEQACAAYDSACDTFMEIRRHDSDRQSALWLAQSLNNRGLMRAELGKLDPGLRDVTQAIELLQELKRDRPANRSVIADLACALSNRALILADTQQWSNAVADLEAAVIQQRALSATSPRDVALRNQLAIGLQNLASLYERMQDLERAESLAVEAVALQTELARRAPDELSYQSDLALGYNNLGVLTLRQQRIAQATQYFQSAVAIGKQLIGRAPRIMYYRRDLAVSVNNLGRSLLADQKFTEAIEQFDEAAILVQTLIQQQGERTEYIECLDGIRHNRSLAEQRLADLQVLRQRLVTDAVVGYRVESVPGDGGEVLP